MTIETYDQYEEEGRLGFARKAAAHFNDHPEDVTFSLNGPERGAFMALRWGMGLDCVLVFTVDEYDTIMNYPQFIDQSRAELTRVYHEAGLAEIADRSRERIEKILSDLLLCSELNVEELEPETLALVTSAREILNKTK